jgi:transposase
MKIVAMDVHRTFAQIAIHEGGLIRDSGRVGMEQDAVLAFGRSLHVNDEIVLEQTGNTAVLVRLLSPFVRRVVVANPLQVRAIAYAKVKTDKIDARVLAKLHASGFLPEVWVADSETERRRRAIAERTQLVRQLTRLKNHVQSVLHANLIPPYKGKLFTQRGRRWLAQTLLPGDQQQMITRQLGEHDRLVAELAVIDQRLASGALGNPQVRRLMTIGGVNLIVAESVLAAIGDIARFSSAEKLVSYFGLNPRVSQSGDHAGFHGRITKQGRSQARAMLVEAVWSIQAAPGPLRAFFRRVQAKKGKQVAAVATARKLTVLIWHMLTKQEDYAWTRPALLQWKLRELALKAGEPSRRGGNHKGPASDYSLQTVRDKECRWLGMAEEEYRRFVSAWKDRPPRTVRRLAKIPGTLQRQGPNE